MKAIPIARAALYIALFSLFPDCTSQNVTTDQRTDKSNRNATMEERLPSPGFIISPPSDGSVIPLLSKVSPIADVSDGRNQAGKFVLDTGTPTTMLSREVATRWRLSVRDIPEVPLATLIDSTSVHQIARIPRLCIGNTIANDVDALLLETLGGVQGIVGFSLLRQHPLLIDGIRGESRVLPDDSVGPFLDSNYPGIHWNRLDMHVDARNAWVDASLDGHRLRMLVDTGALATELQPSVLHKLHIDGTKDSMLTSDASGSRVEQVEVASVKGMQIGSWTFDFESGATESQLLADDGMAGVIGFDFLGRVPCVYDALHGHLWIKDPPTPDASTIQSSRKSNVIACFHDPFSGFRKFAAEVSMGNGSRERLGLVAILLEDESEEVRAAAVATMASFAKASWNGASGVKDAISWWKEHKDDPENRLPAASQR